MGHVSAEAIPVVTLRQAIDRLSSLFRAAPKAGITIDDAVKRLGYAEDDAEARRMVATLAAYGLVRRTPAASLECTRLGQRILQPANQFEHDAALVDAAGMPPLLGAARDHFNGRPLDRGELRHWLRRRGVEKTSLEAAIDVLCKTAAFVHEAQRRMAAVITAVAERTRSPSDDERREGRSTAPAADGYDLEATDIAWE